MFWACAAHGNSNGNDIRTGLPWGCGNPWSGAPGYLRAYNARALSCTSIRYLPKYQQQHGLVTGVSSMPKTPNRGTHKTFKHFGSHPCDRDRFIFAGLPSSC